MKSKQWINVQHNPPPHGRRVLTMSPGGLEQILHRGDGGLWFGDDGCYVYYEPKFWLELESSK